MKEKDLREKLKPYSHSVVIINGTAKTDNDLWDRATNGCVQITLDYAREEAIEFSEWTCGRYIKLNSVWVGIYSDQRDKNNWKTTSELYEIYLTTKTK